ncbi:N-acetylmuramoyl-L-alanine amidase CwlD [Lutispora saccharofermentans]|uniref:N-acetylmuramoyl-L-alanine amidase CwlD n=1 Tax=Lutispora saccharofermentans TaxID=3024236 RepID=A0ABT1NI21_9FIRM|nr:N-acetylmuramoyl-L-alanine amidase CwlD [Lutispora saccharofermentans]MCQ1530897.1 N-acetylmuramoyl-L-alanine amidase CwlD [Lutispora saccharofermentans]
MRLIIVDRRLLIKLGAGILGLVLLFLSSTFICTNAMNAYRIPMKNRVIMIDPGHGGIDPGAVGRTGAVEDDINLQIALKLRKLIEQSGGIGLMIREDDSGLYGDGKTRIRDKRNDDLRERHKMINESGADIFISIHLNSFPQSQYYGAQCFYMAGNEEDKKLAELIQNEMIDVIQNGNTRQAKSINTLYILKNNKMPGVLVECGFLSNPREEKQLQEDKFQEKVAWGIFMGIMKYFEGKR